MRRHAYHGPLLLQRSIAVTNETRHYNWHYVLAMFAEHKRTLIIANLVAAVAALLAVPVPLLVPLLVDEVLLKRGGPLVTAVDQLVPSGWRGPTCYILMVTLATVLLRALSLALQVWQTRSFSLIGKDLIFRIRRELLERLQRVSMAEYEVLGASTVATPLVVDLNTIDEFTGVTLSQLLIAVLTLTGGAAVLLWMHWPLGLFILVMNPAAVYFTMLVSRRVKELKRREVRSGIRVFAGGTDSARKATKPAFASIIAKNVADRNRTPSTVSSLSDSKRACASHETSSHTLQSRGVRIAFRRAELCTPDRAIHRP